MQLLMQLIEDWAYSSDGQISLDTSVLVPFIVLKVGLLVVADSRLLFCWFNQQHQFGLCGLQPPAKVLVISCLNVPQELDGLKQGRGLSDSRSAGEHLHQPGSQEQPIQDHIHLTWLENCR